MKPTPEIQREKVKRTGLIFRILGWLLFSVLLLVLILMLLVQVPGVQQWAKNKVVHWLEVKFKAPVSVGRISIIYPSSISLNKVFLADNQRDTLLYGDFIGIDLDMTALLFGRIILNEIRMKDIQAKLIADSAGNYNFDHILKAFVTEATTTKTDKPSDPIYLDLSNLKLDRVKFRYEDYSGGIKGNFEITQLRIADDSVDFYKQQFSLKSLAWHGGKVSIQMWDSPFGDTSSGKKEPAVLPEFFFREASLSEIEFEYINRDAGMDMNAAIGLIEGKGMNLQLNKQRIDLGNSTLRNSIFNYSTGEAKPSSPSDAPSQNWIITSKNIELINSRFSYNDLQNKPAARGMDYAHLTFSRINLKGDNLYVSGGDTVSANIASGSLDEKSGFRINSIKTNLLYTSKGVKLGNLMLATPYSKIEKDLEIAYESPSLVAENPGNLWIDASFKQAKVSHRDLLTVVPLLYQYPMFADLPNGAMEIDGKVKGFMKNLTIDKITFKGFGNTSVKASGTIAGLPDPDKITTNLVITEFSTTDTDLGRIIPEGLIPPEIELPSTISLKGSIKGNYLEKLDIDAVLQTDMGSISAKGYIKNSTDPKKVEYNLKGSISGFNAGKFLRRTDIGLISLKFDMQGKGFEPSSITGKYAVNLQSLDYAGFTYKNINLNARADNGIIQIQAGSKEDAYAFDIVMLANMKGKYPDIKSTVELFTLDLQKLGYSEKPLTITASSEIDFPKLDMNNPIGYFGISKISGVYDTVSFSFDSLTVIASDSNGMQKLKLNTDFATADITGKYSVSALFPEIINFINLYYIVSKPVPALQGDQQADMKLTLKPSAQLATLFPSLILKNNIDANLKFDSRNCVFDLSGILPEIVMGDHSIKGGSFFADAKDSALGYKIFINDYESNVYSMPTILLQGDIIQRLLYTDIRLLDETGRLQHTLIAFIEQKDSGYAIHIDPTSVTLDYEQWGLDPNNELFIAKKGIIANSFTFSNGAQALVMQTYGSNLNDPIGIRLFNFKISTFTSLARQDSLYLNGTINGYAEVQLLTETPVFFADMDIENLMFKKDTLGNIKIKGSNEQNNVYVLDAAMTGYDNEIYLKGNYNLGLDEFDFQFDVVKLTLKTLEPFVFGYMNQMKGHIEGGLSLTGTLDAPVVIGNMLFRDATANVPLLNSAFSLRNERIRFMQDGIHFNEFTLTDQNEKKAILNGNIMTENWLKYRFNLDFTAEDFRVVNSTRRDNKLFYGTLYLDTKINFRGSTDQPVISAGFRANRKTDLTMVLPQSDPEVAEREGVMEFFDADLPETDSTFEQMVDSLNQTSIKGLTLNANLEIDPAAKLSFVIDEANGDMLIAKGTANLSCSLDPSGKISVTGTYELDEGSYSMSLKMLKFDFDIEKGSTITWTGEPTNADIRVTALYKVKTAPYDLVEQQITGESDETKAKYKDRIPFNVKLIINGELLKPDIRFDIEIAETSGTSSEVVSTINTKLDQLRIDESLMNQQVFALILLGSFIPDNPFASSSSGSSTSTIARQSVSKLLTSHLNQLAGSLISGVDIDIGIDSDEDYSTGTGEARTDLNVALSKRLLKDRLKITVGSNFELEGSARPNEKTSNIAGDIKADYTLTRDGRYVLRAYRVDQYEVALQGQVVETGVTFIINLNFDLFKEIFEKKKKQTITP